MKIYCEITQKNKNNSVIYASVTKNILRVSTFVHCLSDFIINNIYIKNKHIIPIGIPQ